MENIIGIFSVWKIIEKFPLFFLVAAQDTQTSLLNSVVQQEMAVRRQRVGISRQDSRLSVKSLIESIEKSQAHVRKNAWLISKLSLFYFISILFRTQAKSNAPDSRTSSTSSMNSMGSDELTPALQNGRNQINEWNDTIINQNQV